MVGTFYLHCSEKSLSKIGRNILHTLYWKKRSILSVQPRMCSVRPTESRGFLPTATRRSCRVPDISLWTLSCRVFLLTFLYSTRAATTWQRDPKLLAVAEKPPSPPTRVRVNDTDDDPRTEDSGTHSVEAVGRSCGTRCP